MAKMTARRDMHREVAEKIVAQLQSGVRPWARPWDVTADGSPVAGSVGLPLRSCGKPYRGINVLLLWCESSDKGYTSRYWLTYKQAGEFGGQVRKGEKSTRIYYSDRIIKSVADDKKRRGIVPAPGDETLTKVIWFLREYCVFNADQVDGLPERFSGVAAPIEPKAIEEKEFEVIEHAEQFFGDAGATVKHGGNRAFYNITTDHIQMPPKKAFKDQVSYYATLGHEHIHWTGASTRLNRTFGAFFGDNLYALEELVAEMGAAFLCAELGLTCEPREDHAQYLNSWCEKITQKPMALFAAATKASAAVEYMMGRSENEESEPAELQMAA